MASFDYSNFIFKNMFLGSSFLYLLLFPPIRAAEAIQVSYDGGAVIIDGERRVLFSGSIHYTRSTPEMWPDLIQKSKEGGLNAIETYVFWNLHEPRRREYDFSGNLDFIRFLKTVKDAGLYVILRIGPYVCAEWNYGGFPVWLHNLPGIQLRTDNQMYKDEMQNFTSLIVKMCKQEKLFAPQGGPIILAQIENEYGNVEGPYGASGKSYIQWCATMAVSLEISVPWIMCQQNDAPQPMINTCNGFYCDTFMPNSPNSPKIWTENWTGWYKSWGGKDPHRTAEDLAYSVARFFQYGGVLVNYYMYHGGTNFGRTAGGPYITTSYDYDAPLDEYGNLNQPKWGHLKQLHDAIKSVEKILTLSSVTHRQLGNGTVLSKYISNGSGDSVCFLSNENSENNAYVDVEGQGMYFFVPAWSVSILADCRKEVYNSAKINVQTSLMIKKPNEAETEPAQLSWSWRSEPMKDALKGRGSFNSTQLLEQKEVTSDVSDYLWYMTSVEISESDESWSNQATLHVSTTGHVLHAYVNKKLIGSEWGSGGNYTFSFYRPVSLKQGTNYITLLSVTVGLENYGSFFDLVPTGIVGGPVQLIGNEVTKNLSSNQWFYKVGLNGEFRMFYNDQSPHNKWKSEELPLENPMTWYKTNFKPPLGVDPVVVDLQGMGKGHAWVNGRSIGRFWPSFHADLNGCSDTCDYRGQYSSSKCLTNCGNPSQRWYHIPRSFLNDEQNTLVLFEEIGGNPSLVNFQTVTIGTACGKAYEGSILELSCQGGRSFSAVQFASFGDPKGACGSFVKGECHADNSLSVAEEACIGQESCSINISEATFGTVRCSIGSSTNISKRFAVQAVC